MDINDKNIITKPNKAIVTNQLDKKVNNSGITSLVLGIMSVLFCWCFIFPIITGIIGIITGCISIAKNHKGFNLAIAGTVLSISGLILGIIFTALYIIAFSMK